MKEDAVVIPSKEELDKGRGALLEFVRRQVLSRRSSFRGNRHVKEWARIPMNYWRLVELPVALWLMSEEGVGPGQSILDIGSPKLLALYLASEFKDSEVVASDISDYFIADFREFKEVLGLGNMAVELVDARAMEYGDGSVDHVFSVSVLEHVPGDGDSRSMAEVGRVLKPGGTATLTLPYTQTYEEEYLEGAKTYWDEHSAEVDGKTFFQRRYTWKDLMERIVRPSGLEVDKVVLAAERPIEAAKKYSYDGKIVENSNYIEKRYRLLFGAMMVLGFSTQRIHSYYSERYHRFTADPRDEMAMNVALKLRKKRR